MRHHLKFRFAPLFIVLLGFISCTYKSAPYSGNYSRNDGRSPQMLQAQTVAPKFVTSPTQEELDAKAGVEQSVPEKETQSTESLVLELPEDNETTEKSFAAAPSKNIVSQGSSREQEHISFTSYNPFDNGSAFTVDLDAESENFHYPINGHLLSPYGSRGRSWHSGSDIKGEYGDPIYAVFDGEVRMSRSYGGYGNVIVVRHENGLETAYSHNSSNLVKVGDRVKAGQKIALCGRTGRATGTHCHFEVRVMGQTLNPALLLDYTNRRLQSGTLVISRNSSNKILARREGQGSPQDNINRPVPPKQTLASTDNPGSTTIISAKSANDGASSASTNTTPKTSSANAKYHIVSQGDTLYALSRKYGTTVKKICELNNINEKKYLQLKQKLRVL